MRELCRAAACGCALMVSWSAARADEAESIIIVEKPPAEAASSAHLTAKEIEERPHATASDLLRQVPGLVVAQHAGGGKADQLFLRGFDADHGTDVAVFVDGVPANMPSHGHGQGYADTHWLIPDLVTSIDVHKGPYDARFGDFYTAGAVELTTRDESPGLTVLASGGTEAAGPAAFDDPTYRLVAIGGPELPVGKALVAGELWYSDGPFANPQHFRRNNLYARWQAALPGGDLTIFATMYAARWNASGQVPARAVSTGKLDRFGSVDPTEGGDSDRASASAIYDARDDRGGRLRLQLYAVSYHLRLFSDFTFFARDPVNGDEIEQTDARGILGATASYSKLHRIDGRSGVFTVGVQGRADDVDAQLWHDAARLRLADCFGLGANPCFATRSRIRDLGLYTEEDVDLNPWLHATGGARYDLFVWDVDDVSPRTQTTPQSSGGSAQKSQFSPKLSLVARVDPAADLFLNGGFGFHSNDARAAVCGGGDGAVATAKAFEAGARVRPAPGLELSAAAWYLYLSSEQVWNGDEGGTEAAPASLRLGLDFDFSWAARRWLTIDGNVQLARPTFADGTAVPLAPRLMGGGGIAVHGASSSISLRIRGIGPRPANPDDTLTADGYVVADLVASHARGPWRFGVTIDNLFNADWREAQFAETSRLRDEPQAVEDVHFTPGAPLTVLGTVGFVYR